MKSTPVKRRALVGIAALVAVLTANLASATPEDDGPHALVVRYSDLDLSQPGDARRLYARIKLAAQSVCDYSPSMDLVRLAKIKECMGHAVTHAVDAVNASQLTEIRQADTSLVSRN